ncbi:hypothetical protein THRCLA_04058 [Thraustotheca clavata]|uniref:SUEL-type lectin domain-containing protein n=1 Tax=Thraustotheca clavata TaxID=74557 RepID=A0A1W0A0S5_9STRA|nr:hypothetical protein THRCLA_04058 [Thraustotheca clavata]
MAPPALFLTPAAILLGKTIGEGGSITLDCGNPALQITRIIFASYGMPEGNGLRAKTGWCNAGSSREVVRKACVGQSSCKIDAINEVFGDPCVGTVKHLTIAAECSRGPKYEYSASVSEHETLNLTCDRDYIIDSVNFASYGTPNGYSTGSCNSDKSTDVITQSCVGLATCSVAAENDVFGDPCVGTFKALAAKVNCALATPTIPKWY